MCHRHIPLFLSFLIIKPRRLDVPPSEGVAWVSASSCGDRLLCEPHTPRSVSLRSCQPSLFVDVIDYTHADGGVFVALATHQADAVDIHLVGNA